MNAGALMARNVLIVDDDGDTRLALRMMLEDAGYAVDESGDGGDALARLRARSGGVVVLLDYRMPGLDGAAVLAALDEGAADRHVFLLMTASPQRVAPDLAIQLARLDVPVVAKPFEMDELLATVARAADRLPPEANE